MRISVREDDSGYSKKAFGTKVYVDGVEINNCFTADEELGVAYVFQTDLHGELIIDKANQCILEKEVHGRVKIIPH